MHTTGAFERHGRPEGYPVTEKAAAEILSLPMFPGITRVQQERVRDALVEAVGKRVG